MAVAQNVLGSCLPVVAKLQAHTQTRVSLLSLAEEGNGLVDASGVAPVDFPSGGWLWLEGEGELLRETFSKELQNQDDGHKL